MTDNHCSADPGRRTKTLLCMLSAPRVLRQLQDAGLRIKSDRTAYRRFESANKNTKNARIYQKAIKQMQAITDVKLIEGYIDGPINSLSMG